MTTAIFDDVEVGEMDFPEAMREVAAVGRVRRISWPDGYWVYLSDRLKIRKADGTMDNLIVSDGDMLATDWEIT